MGTFYAKVSIGNLNGGDTHQTVAFWPDDSGQCIGATTLQALMLGVDAPNEQLVKVSTARRGWAGDLGRQEA